MLNKNDCRERSNTFDNQLDIDDRYRWYFGGCLAVLVFAVLVMLGKEVYANFDDTPTPAADDSTLTTDIDATPHEYWKPYRIAQGQNLSRIFKHLNIDNKHLKAIMRADPLAKRFRRIKPGQMINFRYVDDVFAGLEYKIGPIYSLLV